MSLRLRVAQDEDMKLIFQWANDTSVRRVSFNSNEIKWEDHVTWFTGLINDKNRILWIGMVDQKEVGQIRLSMLDDCLYIGYSVAKEFRGKGYGKLLIRNAILEVVENKLFDSCERIIGEVKLDNLASIKTFKNLNFKEKQENDKYIFTLERSKAKKMLGNADK